MKELTLEEKEMINIFFNKRLKTNKQTKKFYTQTIKMFFNHTGKTATEYFKEKQTYEDDIQNVFLYMKKNFSPLSVKNRMCVLKIFFSVFDKKTKELDIWDLIKQETRGCRKETEEQPLEKTDIKKILEYSDEQGRAAFLILASSGMRIGELVQLIEDDLHLKENPPRIHIRGETTKTKQQRDTFISPEALESLQLWLGIRPKYMLMNRGRYKKDTQRLKDIVFPMTSDNLEFKWRYLVDKAGYGQRDHKNNKYKVRVHGLRKFFRSNLGDVDLAEILMGHEGYLSTYRAKTLKQTGESYLKHQQNVMIFDNPADLTEINQELQEKDKQIQELLEKQRFLELRMQGLENKIEIEKIKKRN